jgi:hypothetical protein
MEPYGQARGPQEPYPPTPLGAVALRRASAKASVGHPPVSEIRRSMTDLSLEGFLSGVTHSSTAKAVLARRSALQHAGVVSCGGDDENDECCEIIICLFLFYSVH